MPPKQRKRKTPAKSLATILAVLKKKGASEAKLLSPRDIVVDERVRLKCQVPLCDTYGRNLMCPPFLPSVGEFRQALALYESSIIIQVSSGMEEIGGDWFLPARQLHELVNLGEKCAFDAGFRFALGLIGGCCRLCESCVAADSGRTCRHPFKARPSMEAMGIDVQATAEKAGIPFNFPVRDKVVWTGLILL